MSGSYVSAFDELEGTISKMFADSPAPQRDNLANFLNNGELKRKTCREEFFAGTSKIQFVLLCLLQLHLKWCS